MARGTIKRYLWTLFITGALVVIFFEASVNLRRTYHIQKAITKTTLGYTDALLSRTSPNGTVILVMVDYAFVDMAINFYQTSLKRFNITNFLFIGGSQMACQEMITLNIPCYTYANDTNGNKASVYMSAAFIQKMNIRTDMILEALYAGFTVIHSDADMVFLSNPLPELQTTKGDIAMLWDNSAYNAGFLIVRPTSNGKWIYNRTKQITTKSPKTDDQTALNRAVSECTKSKTKNCKASTLPVKTYLCGLTYFEKGGRMFAGQNPCKDCKVVHNNWIVSKEAKVYRFKETGLWLNDKNSYYSSQDSFYIMYNNTWNVTDKKENLKLDTMALKNALYLGTLLHRSVILPRFHCPDGSVTRCPLNSFYNMVAFDSQFAENYREHSFLKHHLVPDKVKQSTTLFQERPWNDTTSLVGKLKTISSHILEINNLQHIHFDYDPTFQSKIDKGFKAGKYRQL